MKRLLLCLGGLSLFIYPLLSQLPSSLFEECDRDFCTIPNTKEEKQLLKNVCQESRRLYQSLDCEGKNKAIFLANQLEDKDQAIQEAAREMAQRQRLEFPNQDNYSKQTQKKSGQYLYNDRFGY